MFEIFNDQNDAHCNKLITSEKQIIKNPTSKYQNKNKKLSQNRKITEKNVLSILKNLSEEETELMMERNQLLDIEIILKKRIINEIETKKTNISNLQTEIPELKQRIEDLAKLLEIPILK